MTHVELISVRLDEATTLRDAERLSSDEQARADRIITQSHRDAFIKMRSSLRSVLASKLKYAPEDIRFEYSSDGKPSVLGVDWHFNISHTHGIGLIALRETYPVGVDIERYRPLPEHTKLAQRYFCDAELARLTALPDAARLTLFYRYWTRKEAIIKALGRSFAQHSREVDVSTIDDQKPPILSSQLSPDLDSSWRITDLSSPTGTVAAVAGRGHICVDQSDLNETLKSATH